MKMIEYLYLVMLCASIVLLYFAYKQYNTTQKLIQTGIKTKARVIDLIAIPGDDGYTYKPVFEYTTRSNEVITFESDIRSRPAPYKIGDTVNIIYNKEGNQQKVVSFWGLYRWTVFLLCFACPLLIIGGGYIFYTKF